MIRLVPLFVLGPSRSKTIWGYIINNERHYYPIQNSKEHLNIIEVSMELGNCCTRKYNRGLSLLISVKLEQLRMQFLSCQYFPSFTMMLLVKIFSPMQLHKKTLTLHLRNFSHHLQALNWTTDCFLSMMLVFGIILFLRRGSNYYSLFASSIWVHMMGNMLCTH